MAKKERLVITVKPGETYYVNMHNGFWRERMDLVSREKGAEKIQKCQLAISDSDKKAP